MSIRSMRRVAPAALALTALTALVGAALLGATTAHAQTTTTCEQTGFHDMTAALVNPTRPVTGTVDATVPVSATNPNGACDIGVYFGPGFHGTINHANISNAIAFGVVVNGAGANVTITRSSIHDILGAPGADMGEDECDSCGGGGDEGGGGSGGDGYIGDAHGTGILVYDGAHANISGNSVSTYGRRGISISTYASATISNNTITGLGPSYPQHTMGQSGVWIANGSHAFVVQNTITNNLIIGSGPASNAVMVAGGDYHNGQDYTSGIQISGNTFRNNATGVLLSNLPLPVPVKTSNYVTGNVITLNVPIPQPVDPEETKPTAGILVAGGNGDKIIGNYISGYTPAIKIASAITSVTLVQGNTIIP